MFSYYGKLSTEVYDIDKPIGLSFGDVEYYSERLRGCEGKVLEPAVGTGRILIPLIEAGFDVDGMDCSEDMLSLCQKYCEERNMSPRLFEDNMESFSVDDRYEAIILPTGSFLLLQNREDSLKALKTFHDHLEPGGRLIVDIFMQTDFKPGTSSTRVWNTTEGDMITLEEKQVAIDHINQFTVSHMKYEKWRNKVLIQSELENFPLRWYGVEEFRTILENIGYTDIVISSDYKYDVYPTNDTETITFEAYRKKQ